MSWKVFELRLGGITALMWKSGFAKRSLLLHKMNLNIHSHVCSKALIKQLAIAKVLQ